MDSFRIINISEQPELRERAAEWFHLKWGIPAASGSASRAEILSRNGTRSVAVLYLVTDHTTFYERYGWSFLEMVQETGSGSLIRMYRKAL